MDKLIEHRNSIIEKCKLEDTFSREELYDAGINYKKLSDEQAVKIMVDSHFKRVDVFDGAAASQYFFLPYKYENVIVDADDIFALGYTTSRKVEANNQEAIECVAFTNDPYSPVFPFRVYGQLGFFELTKSKTGRAAIELLFTLKCKNLKYSIQDLSKLDKEIKSENSVRGNIPYETMRNYISDAKAGRGIFNAKKIPTLDKFKGDTWICERVAENGYMTGEDIDKALNINGLFTKKFWKKKSEEANNMIMQRLANERQN